jgi:glycosyltransferase involved in cell wall biosynthesis
MNWFTKLFKKKSLTIQIEGTYENNYSLSIVNQSIALALDTHTKNEIKIDATKHHEAYMKEQTDLDPKIVNLANKVLQHIDVSLRNIYPPHTEDMKGKIKIIGSYGWEESKFPQEFVSWFNNDLDMVLTMSEYVKDVLQTSGVKIPVITVGLVVEDILDCEAKPFHFDFPDNFRLLHVSSCFPRKGVDKILDVFDAFCKEDSLDISLIIKTFPNEHNKVLELLTAKNFILTTMHEEEIFLFTKNTKQIILINKNIPREQMRYLYENANLLVAPSFGEGFGLPHAEAMLLDLPVITTGYGGQCDFCTQETSWLIDYEFKPAHTHMHLDGSLWAVPKTSSLKALITEIYHLPQHKISEKTTKAKLNILHKYSSKTIASNIIKAISTI